MEIGYTKWREGGGYDLDALENISASERASAVKMLAARLKTNPNWREIEALGARETAAGRLKAITR
jgi:hypothetical protein